MAKSGCPVRASITEAMLSWRPLEQLVDVGRGPIQLDEPGPSRVPGLLVAVLVGVQADHAGLEAQGTSTDDHATRPEARRGGWWRAPASVPFEPTAVAGAGAAGGMMPGVTPAEDARSLFSLPRRVAYLNTAYMGPLPRASVEAGWMALDRKAHPWTVVADDFFVPGETYRGLIADLLGLDAEGVAITPAVSFGLSTFAGVLPLAPDDVIVVPAEEFPSNLNPWSAAAVRVGASVVRVPAGADGDITAAMEAEVAVHGERVALVAAPPCHWIDGSPIDLPRLGAAARSVGAALAVDVCQTLGAVPFDGPAVAPDVVAGATYKWLLGPYSLGFAWFAPRWRDGPPLDHGWSNRAGADDFSGLTAPSSGYRPGARRYDVGEPAQHLQMPVALASLHLVTAWDPAATAAHARRLTDRIADGAAALGFEVAPAAQRSDHLIGLRLGTTATEPAPLAAALADAHVHVSVRGRSVRVSAHRFNDDEDVDRLLDALAAAVGSPGPP